MRVIGSPHVIIAERGNVAVSIVERIDIERDIRCRRIGKRKIVKSVFLTGNDRHGKHESCHQVKVLYLFHTAIKVECLVGRIGF